ncbi:hypothetical protein [Paraburkholderia caballeronis]|uniref:hypothetical protein n=1 Tax=Paraburkholderia caballeronis TaxID=416943 RepID=UPI001FB94C2D|nr:hypothetical protein [Paraburkholderia caballeronis]
MSVTALAAAGDIAAYREVPPRAPLLVLRRTSRLADGRVCEATGFPFARSASTWSCAAGWRDSAAERGAACAAPVDRFVAASFS